MSEERTQYTTQRYAELESQIADSAPDERTQYTTPDEVADKLLRMEAYIKQLENTINGFNMVMAQHRATIAEQTRRIVELEKQLASVPVDAVERFHDEANMIDPVYVESGKFDDDHGAIREWLDSRDGDA